METLVLSFVLFAVIVLVLVAATLIGGRNLRGSCGGPNCACNAEGEDVGSCEFDGTRLPTHQP